jgi:hypothetical protein
MALQVRPVDHIAEREGMLEVLERNLTEVPHEKRFDWFYGANPSGSPYSWMIVEEKTQQAAGIASLISRGIWLGAEMKTCGQVGDFGIDRAYRSLGPAVQLQRATFSPVDRGELALCYDCPPHESGMSTFRRLGMQANCRMRRYLRILKTDRIIARRLGSGLHSAAAAKLANVALQVAGARGGENPPGNSIERLRDRFGDEFTSLDQRDNSGNTIRGRRIAADLNWLYRENPLQTYEVLAARSEGKLMGYIIYFSRAEDAFIMEAGGALETPVIAALLNEVAKNVRAENPSAQAITALLSESHPFIAGFERAGFLAREEAERVVAYAAPGSATRKFLEGNPRWQFQFSDVTA